MNDDFWNNNNKTLKLSHSATVAKPIIKSSRWHPSKAMHKLSWFWLQYKRNLTFYQRTPVTKLESPFSSWVSRRNRTQCLHSGPSVSASVKQVLTYTANPGRILGQQWVWKEEWSAFTHFLLKAHSLRLDTYSLTCLLLKLRLNFNPQNWAVILPLWISLRTLLEDYRGKEQSPNHTSRLPVTPFSATACIVSACYVRNINTGLCLSAIFNECQVDKLHQLVLSNSPNTPAFLG